MGVYGVAYSWLVAQTWLPKIVGLIIVWLGLIPRPSLPPLLECLQSFPYHAAKTGGGEGMELRAERDG